MQKVKYTSTIGFTFPLVYDFCIVLENPKIISVAFCQIM